MKHKFFALCLTLVMAMSAVTFFSACGEEKTPSGDANVTGPSGSGQNPDEGNKNPDESGEGGQPAPEEEKATEGLHYTPIYGEDGTTAIGYIVGAGETAEEEKIVIPAKHDGLPVLRIGFPEDFFEPYPTYGGIYFPTKRFIEEYSTYVEGLGYDPQKLEGDKENEELYLKVLYSFYQQYTFSFSKAKTIKIPNGVTQLGFNAFAACDIESLYLPESVTKIENAFPNSLVSFCDKLTKIEVSEKNPVYRSEGNCLIETATKTVVAGCKTSVIPEGVLAIGACAFASIGFGSLDDIFGVTGSTEESRTEEFKEIGIPRSVTSIQEYAFFQCFGLKRILYGGTAEEWNNIDKAENWRENTTIEEVVCTNGTLTEYSDIG